MSSIDSLSLVRSLLTLTLFASFIALWVWAWSARRRGDFDAAANLALHDDTHASESEQP
jgi:cytochrome c oxidase cbb3-type subunit IV